MKPIANIASALALTMLAGCSSSGSNPQPAPAPSPPPPVEEKIAFTEFVDLTFARDPDDEPLEVDDENLIFDAEDDPEAFDDLLAQGI